MPGNAVEIVGKVQGDLSVRVLMATDFGANIGMFLSLLVWYAFRMGTVGSGLRKDGWREMGVGEDVGRG